MAVYDLEEQEQISELKAWWAQYGNFVVTLAVLAALAVLLSAAMTLINTYLPILNFQELPAEVLARTHPSPIDLLIALAGGLAAAYALTRANLMNAHKARHFFATEDPNLQLVFGTADNSHIIGY